MTEAGLLIISWARALIQAHGMAGLTSLSFRIAQAQERGYFGSATYRYIFICDSGIAVAEQLQTN